MKNEPSKKEWELVYSEAIAGLKFAPGYDFVKETLKSNDPLVLEIDKDNQFESHEKGAIKVMAPFDETGELVKIGFIKSADLDTVHIALENYETKVTCYHHTPGNKPWDRVHVAIWRKVEE